MLIEHYDLDVFTPPDGTGAEKFTAIARLTVDISEVLPYLNATLHGAVYQRAANALTWKKGEHHLTLHTQQIAVGNVEDYDVAVAEIDELVTLINHTWDRRAEITPVMRPVTVHP
jgi:ArsR family metal-binding transcriptional regulator